MDSAKAAEIARDPIFRDRVSMCCRMVAFDIQDEDAFYEASLFRRNHAVLSNQQDIEFFHRYAPGVCAHAIIDQVEVETQEDLTDKYIMTTIMKMWTILSGAF